ncbi:MAG: tetratricopeptide repeat protein [Candidatus Hydrogenedentes bacterium]|nr:tetratricopeptide repeat protein [Candidatus Hydrogenedentota bacterium]
MSILQEIRAVRENAGIWTRADYTVLQFTGADAAAWLHAQTTNEVKGLQSGEGGLQCLLDRTGRIQTVFSLHRWEDEYWAIIEKAQVAAVQARLESHLFLEKVSMTDVGADTPQICIEGPRSRVFLSHVVEAASPEEAARTLPETPNAFGPARIDGKEVLVFQHSLSGEDGYLLLPAPGGAEALCEYLMDRGFDYLLTHVSQEARRVLRIEAGHPKFGVDIDTQCVVSETPLESEAVNYAKGCYLGQEVVARLRAYGSPKQMLTGLQMPDTGAQYPDAGTPLLVNGKKAGVMQSSAFSPVLGRWIGLASLDREHRVAGQEYAFSTGDGAQFTACVVALPHVEGQTRAAFARRLYEEALDHFERDLDDEDDAGIVLLKESILLDPGFEDAYEALGVILHRHHELEEAIHYMKQLAILNPNCVMAHSNLSVFYVAKGMIQEAEEEKAIAGQLEFKRQLDTKEAEKHARAERERIMADARQKVEMFEEVLEIDPDDPIATMGLGSAYMQLEAYEEAIPPLRTAIASQKDYSAAFLKLGKCYELLGRHEEAVDTYTQGIAVASRKGDLMPLREMERGLKGLKGRSEG